MQKVMVKLADYYLQAFIFKGGIMREKLQDIISKIENVDSKAAKEAQDYCVSLLKIPGSLGRIEDLAVQLSSITGKTKNNLDKKCIIMMSADNGIVAQNVSSAPQSVTVTMTECFSKMVTGVGVFARAANAKLYVYDIGVNGDINDKAVINKKIMRGTNDFSLGPAMSEEAALKAIFTGIEAVKTAIDDGYEVIGTGEMGIGNTSTSTAVICALSGAKVKDCVGSGTGMVNDEAMQNKIDVINRGLTINKPNPDDPVDVLAKVGGLDIAALCGVFIGCAYYKVPAVIDGYISSAAAYAAFKLCPKVRGYMIESHITEEVGYKVVKEQLNLKPMFDLNMRLGEGSGCPFTFFAIDCANSMMNNMYTFEQGMISEEYTDKIDELKF